MLAALTALPLILHALRRRITLGAFFGLAGVCSIMLWQMRQMGWWVKFFDINFDTGLTLFIPPILIGALLTFAFDGLRTFRSYLLMVTTACVAAWLFSAFREALSLYVPLPYLIVLSNQEHLAIIGALLFSQFLAVMIYVAVSKWSYYPALPISMTLSLILWLAFYSMFNYGAGMGMANIKNESLSFLLSGLPSILGISLYGFIMAARGMVMPARGLGSLLSIWRTTEPNLAERDDEVMNRRGVISELQLLNRRLDINNNLIEYHMEHATYGIVITDKPGKIRRANKPSQELMGSGDMVGLDMGVLLNNVLERKGTFLEMIEACDGRRWKASIEGGKTRWYDLMVTLLKDGDSAEATGYYFLINDITAIVDEEARQLVKHRIRNLNETSRVLGHDFSNLLIGAEAQLRKIRERTLDEESHEAITGLSCALKHAREMLKQLGAGSQFGSPVLKVGRMGDFVRQAVDICRGVADEAGVHFHLKEGLEYYVDADSSQLIRVCTNLARNAIRASSPGGEITITISQRGNGVEVIVADEGCGMSEEEIKQAFEPGFSTKGDGKGGLGLAISYLMVDAHGGHLDLRRNPDGKGVEAVVWLPESHHHTELSEYAGQNVIVLSQRTEKTQRIIAELEQAHDCRVAEAYSEAEVLALVSEEADWEVLLVDDKLDDAEMKHALAGKLKVKKMTFEV